jgi:hypothetical protein
MYPHKYNIRFDELEWNVYRHCTPVIQQVEYISVNIIDIYDTDSDDSNFTGVCSLEWLWSVSTSEECGRDEELS